VGCNQAYNPDLLLLKLFQAMVDQPIEFTVEEDIICNAELVPNAPSQTALGSLNGTLPDEKNERKIVGQSTR
jgi:hypothetical protein